MITVDTIAKYALSLPERPERKLAAQQHFDANGLHGVTFLTSIHGERFGLKTVNPYAVDDKSATFFTGFHETGIFLSHYVAWQIAALGHQPTAILEDDSVLESGWKESTDAALRDVPADFDFLFVGSCGLAGAVKSKVRGNVWRVSYGVSCFHFYIVSPAGAQKLMDGIRKAFAPVDLATYVDDPLGGHDAPFKRMKVFAISPRMVTQRNTSIPD